MVHRLFLILTLCFGPAPARAAEIMFEGYYRVENGGKHIGYAIQRYEFEPKDKSFHGISFLRAKFGDKTVQESLKAKTNDKFQPQSYQYTSQIGEDVKMIDASFQGEIMKLKINDGKKVRDETHKIPKGTFFSSFLTYLMLQKPLALNQAFQYSAIAEEEGASYNGKALLESKETKNGLEVYRILNSFKGDKFVSQVAIVKDPKDATKNIRGEVLGTSSPVKSIATRLVTAPSEATENQTVPNKVLVTLFGGMPTGKTHLLEKKPGP
ncbi:MAG TPA: hypothetical protein PKC28_15970 [Bdellovibrionales bacterium]|nr:hypothetical protein [Bdellovibrionales bacterium]